MRRSLAWCVIALPLLACQPDVGAQRAAVNGTVDSAEEFSGVLGMRIEKPEGIASCTGVLIERNLLLTARHCVSPTQPQLICGSAPLGAPVAGANVFSTKDVTVTASSIAVTGLRVEVPPDGNDECGFDIAAVILADEVPGDADVYPPRLDVPVSTGETFTAVGYGTTGSGGLGTRRVAPDVRVACIGGVDCAAPEAQDTEWIADDGAFCVSDSGAPAISPDGQLLGVVSKGLSPCNAPIVSSVYAWREWIRSVGRMAADEGGYPAPAWAAAAASDGGAPLEDGGSASADGGLGDGGPEREGGCSIRPAVRTTPGVWALLGALLVWRRRRA